MNIALFLIVVFLAVGFAWEMRGDLIGGEEGAMFPGAILGLVVAFFVPMDGLKEYFFIPMTLGMVGMFFGGTEPYAETFDFTYFGKTIKDKPSNLLKGLVGLAVKGSAWFGICASVLGIGIRAFSISNVYEWYELVLLVVLIPVARLIGIRIFNKPYDKEKKKFPLIYFSKESREEWGGLVLINLLCFFFAMSHNDWFSVIIIAFGTLGGAISWIIAQMAHAMTKTKMKNGKYFFGKLQEKGYIDNWKLMEFLFGALGSVFIALGFIIQKNTIYTFYISNYTVEKNNHYLCYIFIALFFIDAILNLFMKKNSTVKKIKDIIHRPIICYIPMAFIFLGDYRVAVFGIITVLVWQPLEELLFYQLYKIDVSVKFETVLSFICIIATTVFSMIYPSDNITSVDYIVLFIILSAEYIICASSWNILRHMHIKKCDSIIKSIKEMKEFQSVKINYLLCVAASSFLMLYEAFKWRD